MRTIIFNIILWKGTIIHHEESNGSQPSLRTTEGKWFKTIHFGIPHQPPVVASSHFPGPAENREPCCLGTHSFPQTQSESCCSDNRDTVKGKPSTVIQPWIWVLLLTLITCGPWARYLMAQSLSLLICKMGTVGTTILAKQSADCLRTYVISKC